ncbi:MAG: (2Fe-2S)-binding protein [Dehalococcoidia bacterium]
MKQPIRLKVNNEIYELEVDAHRLLLDVLRDDLGLTGARRGCDGTGFCGACTVILDGMAVHSCSVLAVRARDREIVTIEGLARNGNLHPLQQAFVEHNAVQCGYCTPGVILSAKALLDQNPHPTEAEVRAAIAGNLCRCTGYVKIVEAILAASRGKEA